jgi:hypothetical protein
MTRLRKIDPAADVATSTARAPSILELAESREQFATPAKTKEIAAWVNEGGAGGEVRR